jgi:hypothetical protein
MRLEKIRYELEGIGELETMAKTVISDAKLKNLRSQGIDV